MRKLLILLLLNAVSQFGLSQDIQFSQFYANALYINPAFAGGLNMERITFHYRGQWRGLDAKFNTYLASADMYFHKSRSGLGLYVLRDVQGNNTISSTEVAFDYAYQLNITRTLTFRMGGQLSVISRFLDYSQLRFPSQYTDDGFQSPTSVSHAIGNDRTTFPDVSFGGLLYNKNFWTGIAAHHLNQPEQSFIQDNVYKLPIRWSVIGGYKILLYRTRNGLHIREEEKSITPTFQYKKQGSSDQVDLGAYLHYHQIMVGLWYRGIPFKQLESIQNNEAMIAMLGFRFKHWVFRYSYDFTVSTLSQAGTSGAHEISFSLIDFIQRHKRKPPRSIPCPNFM